MCRKLFELADGDSLDVAVTEEGIIIDAIRDGEIVGTMGMMADEWYDYVRGEDPLSK